MRKTIALFGVAALIAFAVSFTMPDVKAVLATPEYKYNPYSAGNFFGSGGPGGLVWTQPTNAGVLPPNINTFRYIIVPHPSTQYPSSAQMHIQYDSLDGQISGNRSNGFLMITIPEGKVANAGTIIEAKAAVTANGVAWGEYEDIYCMVGEWSPYIACRRYSVGATRDWPAITNLRLSFNTVIEVVDPIDAH